MGGQLENVTEYHSVGAFAREEPRVELIEAMLRSLLSLVELEYQGERVQVDGFRFRRLEDWRTVNESSLLQNLGSLSTVCNCHCRFCYEDGNPAGLFEKEPRFVSIQEAKTRERYLREGRGLPRESKGFFEPLANPDFLGLLRLVRAHDTQHIIDVTTNGVQLTPELVEELVPLAPVYLNVSLNSSDAQTRGRVMGAPHADRTIRAIRLLRRRGIPFMGTIVPWPEQGLDDIERTLEFLDEHEARLIRVSMPGLTRHHPRYRPDVVAEWLPLVKERVLAVRARVQTPIVISPHAHVTTSVAAIVEGVVRNSPAAAAGIQLGDLLTTIDGRQVVSRSHAADLLNRAAEAGSAQLEVSRGQESLRVTLTGVPQGADAYPYQMPGYERLDFPGMRFGLVLPGSFRLQYAKQIYEAIRGRGAHKPLIVSSPYYRELVEGLLAALPLADVDAHVVVPENAYFGGDVDIGDLWVLQDVADAVRKHIAAHGSPDLILLPSSFLSRWSRDLLGVPHTELERALGIDVVLVRCGRILL
jgi:uncharacterized Fe-S cluster-containing radical SAM superfamily protein